MSTVVSVERTANADYVVFRLSSGLNHLACFREFGEAREVCDAVSALLAENERLKDEAARVRKLVEALAKAVMP